MLSNSLQIVVPKLAKSPNLTKISKFVFFQFLPKVSTLPSNWLQNVPKQVKSLNLPKILNLANFGNFCVFSQKSKVCFQTPFKLWCRNWQNHKIWQKSQNLHFFNFCQKMSDLLSNCLQNVPKQVKSLNLPKISNLLNFGKKNAKSVKFAFKLCFKFD